MKKFVSRFSKALFGMGFILVEDENGCFHLRDSSESEKIGKFQDLNDLVLKVETDLENKSDDLCELLNLFWEEHFEKVSAK